MEQINHNGVKGIFIPYEEYLKGKFFNESELIKLQETTLAQRKRIEEFEKGLIQ